MANSRPKTCDAMAKADPTLGEAGCKRLPRHGGEHRGTLTLRAAKVKAVKAVKAQPKAARFNVNKVVRDIRASVGQPRGRLNAAKRREAMTTLFGMVDSGAIKASDALAVAGRLQ